MEDFLNETTGAKYPDIPLLELAALGRRPQLFLDQIQENRAPKSLKCNKTIMIAIIIAQMAKLESKTTAKREVTRFQSQPRRYQAASAIIQKAAM